MSSSAAINIVNPAEFDPGTAQTPGSERRAAIAPAVGIASAIWGGLFEVEPGSRTGIHHHGEQETIAYVLSGTCEVGWGDEEEFVARAIARRCAPGSTLLCMGLFSRFFVQVLPCTAEGALCRVRDTRSLAPRAYGTNRSNSLSRLQFNAPFSNRAHARTTARVKLVEDRIESGFSPARDPAQSAVFYP
jgi:hypothetical protein